MRTIDEIYAEMAAEYESRCALVLREGGDMSLRLYAVAAQVLALERALEFSRRQAFPQTAEGEYLDKHAKIRALSRGGAAKASGVMRFFVEESAASDIAVSAGTVCTDIHGTEFVTTEDAVIAAGSLYCEVRAEAGAAGEGGNMPAGAICLMPLPPVGVAGCQNPSAFKGGSAGESDESLRGRVLSSYSSLPNGANTAYYESQALGVDGVYEVQVLPKKRGLGTVDVVVASESGAPTEETIAAVSALLEEQREICVDISVYAPEEIEVAVSVEIASEDMGSATAAAQESIEAFFGGALLGKGVLLSKLGNVLFKTAGVDNYRIISPASDIDAVEGALPVLGSLSISEMGA